MDFIINLGNNHNLLGPLFLIPTNMEKNAKFCI